MTMDASRDLAENLAFVQNQIAQSCARSGRSPTGVTIVAITKTFPPAYISNACALGLIHIGENRVQEIIEKFSDGRLARGCPDLQLHLVGHLQTNKARKALQYTATVDSVDSSNLAELISRVAGESDKIVRILLEVNTSGEPQKFGVMPGHVIEIAENILMLPHLRLAGLMTVGPNISEESAIRRSFAVLRESYERVGKTLSPPHWSVLSMGMSGDYPIAVEEGATEIRLGTALFGARSYP